jgi:hypothetical protein
METQLRIKPSLAFVLTLAIALSIALPLWAFFNVTVRFPPMLGDDERSTTVNMPVDINLIANDADADGMLIPSTVRFPDLPKHGTVTLNPETGVCTYSPGPGYTGMDRFSYRITDDEGIESNIGLVTINVQPAVNSPVAQANGGGE